MIVTRLEVSVFCSAGVVTDQGSFTADVVVLAAGTSVQKLAESAGVHIPLTSRPPTLTALTRPLPPTLRHMIITGKIVEQDVMHYVVHVQEHFLSFGLTTSLTIAA